jgi:hypothetical protein
MSDQNTPREEFMVKPYLNFIDTNVLFKKPISCLYAIVSLLTPVFFLIQLIQFELFKTEEVKIIIASILLLLVFAFSGIFGALIWWHRRINRDEGPLVYMNFRRFIQTVGEWTGTVFAINVFGGVIILTSLLSETYYMITSVIPFPMPFINPSHALYGPIIGFLIIIGTKIFLFLLDPVIWLIKQIWKLFTRIILYCYRFVISLFGTFEKNTPVWVGVTWLLTIAAIIASLVLCFVRGGIIPAVAIVASLAFLGYFMYKRKLYDGK